MPIYEYECPSCSGRFDKRRSFTDNSPVSCPKCQCEARRIFSPVPIIFKGSGFYTTDYRGNHGHSEPANGTDEAKTGSTQDEAKTASTKDEAKTNSTDEKS
ncbi:MAG: zinc ribbon domain-containing protein [Dehalococcoidales bacterium]